MKRWLLFLRRIGICEERGSGIDKVVFQTEFFQLPAPTFEVTPEHTRAILFGHKDFKDMGKEDRTRACYLHCCLKYVNRQPMNNTSISSNSEHYKNSVKLSLSFLLRTHARLSLARVSSTFLSWSEIV